MLWNKWAFWWLFCLSYFQNNVHITVQYPIWYPSFWRAVWQRFLQTLLDEISRVWRRSHVNSGRPNITRQTIFGSEGLMLMRAGCAKLSDDSGFPFWASLRRGGGRRSHPGHGAAFKSLLNAVEWCFTVCLVALFYMLPLSLSALT